MAKLKSTLMVGAIAITLAGCQNLAPQQTAKQSTVEPVQVLESEPVLVQRTEPKVKPEWDEAPIKSVLLELEKDPKKADLWEITRNNMRLDHNLDKKVVQQHVDWYVEHDKYLNRLTGRASRYYHFVLHEVIKRGMPAEIALIPAVESSYDPFAKSPAKASGAWQFMPATGDHYGLKRNWWYDGRRDIVASTHAALDYLEYLHDYLDGDWLLAMAAYNAGEGTVGRAVKRNKKAGKPTDFWNLKLPRETRHYVPKILAISEVFKHPEKHGLALAPLADKPYFEIVDTGGQIDLSRAAELSGVELDEIYKLNAGFSQWATDPEGPHQLLIPVDNAARFKTELASLAPSDRVNWARYEVKPGDSLSVIAKRFNTNISTIQTSNDLKGSLIRVGQSLLIPSALVDASQYRLSVAQRSSNSIRKSAPAGSKKILHTVKSGDSLWKVAQRYGVDHKSIARWNNFATSKTLKIGERLAIFKADDQASSTAEYLVRKGDNLSVIAQRHNISVQQLLKWNDISIDTLLMPGQPLRVKQPEQG